MSEILTNSPNKSDEILFTYIHEVLEQTNIEAVFAELFSEVEQQIKDIDK